MKKFMDEDFLLTNDMARKLFHEAAAEPIFDYHCHLNPQEIAANRRFDNLSEVWLGGDHYKWRAMRANGVDERLITGDGDPYDKFLAWAKTVPLLFGNPLYHWTHLELQRYFDIYEPLSADNAAEIWKAANDKLKNAPELSVYGIFKKFNVYAVGTTDDPVDSLEFHEKAAADTASATKVLPSWRPDPALDLEKDGFAAYIGKLAAVSGTVINNLAGLKDALKNRVDFFNAHGCRAADHALEYVIFEPASDGSTGSLWEKEADDTFRAALAGKKPDARAAEAYKSHLLCFLAGLYYDKGWAMQLHAAALRNTNAAALAALGPNSGYDGIADHHTASKLARLLDAMHGRGKLPKTILYSLNSKDHYPMLSIAGCFQDGAPGKMQLGSSWWFLDNKDGMEEQMRILANGGLLSRFVGMLTDSRSFLSYPRHEYFRRILCNLLGTWVEAGEIPGDFSLLSGYVKDISFANAKRYFA
jgi:glucuronate isomerase